MYYFLKQKNKQKWRIKIGLFILCCYFEVEQTHTYYVGTEGVLAHNAYSPATVQSILATLTVANAGKQSNKIFSDIRTTTNVIADAAKDSNHEINFLEAICINQNIRAFTPNNTSFGAVDGMFENGKLFQVKTTVFSRRTRLTKKAYDSCKKHGVSGVELYLELKDMTSSQIAQQWRVFTGNPNNVMNTGIKNDGTFSKFICQGIDGIWVELDLNLLPN